MEPKLSHQRRRDLEVRAIAAGITIYQDWSGDRYGNLNKMWFAKGGEYVSEPSITKDAALYASQSIGKRLLGDSIR
jgi:hypothetical protein